MISKAMKCDRDGCSTIDMLDADEYDTFINEGTAAGWVRLFVNKPSKYSFRREERTDLEGWYDVCSVSCAQDILRTA